MKDFFGNEIDVEKVGTPAKFGWPMQVNEIALIINNKAQLKTVELALRLHLFSIKVSHPQGAFFISLDSLPVIVNNESGDQSIPSSNAGEDRT